MSWILDRVDSTTLDFIFTKKLRKHDLGILILSSVDGFLGIQIPPKMDEIKFTTTCYPDCSTVNLNFSVSNKTFRHFLK